MSIITAENVLSLIAQLPAPEQDKLRQLWDQQPVAQPLPAEPQNGASAHSPKAPRDKRMPPIATPADLARGELAMHWVYEHMREYKNQWVALDGDRLIAAGPNHDEVWAAAKADGAHVPFIELVQDPDNIIHIIWT